MLRPKYNFEFSDIDKLREIVTEKKNKYNYLFIFSMILLVLTLVLSIIFAIFNHHFLCLMFFFFFTTSFIPIHICCNVEEIYKQNKNILDMYNKITELKASDKVSDIRLCYQYGHLEISYFDENDILRKDSYCLNIDKTQLYYYKKQNYLIRGYYDVNKNQYILEIYIPYDTIENKEH
jgi:hypothetical protein